MSGANKSLACFFLLLWLSCGQAENLPPLPEDECKQDQDCDDGVSCTKDKCTASVGGVLRCLNEPRDDLCGFLEKCIPAPKELAGCQPESVLACLGLRDGSKCEVPDPCRSGPGTCVSGVCKYPLKECPPLPCKKSYGCEGSTGECLYEPLEDGSFCIIPDQPCLNALCKAGECIATGEPPCDDKNPCTIDACVSGQCENTPVTDGAPCDDGDPCTVQDSCNGGVCVPGKPKTCDDHNPCTVDFCTPSAGCTSVPVEDGSPCLENENLCRPGRCEQGKCENVSDLVCDDGNPCTREYCDKKQGCVYTKLSDIACDDGNVCTKGDKCINGVCISGKPVTCEDTDPCTLDACDPKLGCTFTPIIPCCGNFEVEPPEQCDAGPSGTAGCSQKCEYRPILISAPPAGGRFPSIAWRGQKGLLLYEVSHQTRHLVTRVMSADMSVSEENLIYDYKTTGILGNALAATPSSTLPFFAAVLRPNSVDLFALDETGNTVKMYMDAWPVVGTLESFAPARVAVLGEQKFLVAWQDGVFCQGTKPVPVVKIALANIASGTFGTPAQFGPASCLPWSPAVLGDSCGAEGAGFFVYAERVPGPKVRQVALPFDEAGLGSPKVLAENTSDSAIPGACGASTEGQSFVMVYFEFPTTGVLRLTSTLLDRAGNVLAGPWTLEELSYGSGLAGISVPACGSISPLADGRFIFAAPKIEVSTSGEPTGVKIFIRLLDQQGAPTGEKQILEAQEASFALIARSALGPRGDIVLAWYETQSMPSDFYAHEPATLKVYALWSGLF